MKESAKVMEHGLEVPSSVVSYKICDVLSHFFFFIQILMHSKIQAYGLPNGKQVLVHISHTIGTHSHDNVTSINAIVQCSVAPHP